MAQHIMGPTEVNYTSTLVPTGQETGNSIVGNDLDNTITGNGYVDIITGNGGDDVLYGMGGNDMLIGGDGNDQLYGGSGDDFLSAGDGMDVLVGGTGADTMYGGANNDQYYYATSDNASGEFDTINDDKSNAGNTGYGGGTDVLTFTDVTGANLRLYQIGNDLYVTDAADVADGYINEGVIIEDFFSGGNNVIDYIVGSDGAGYDMTGYI